MDTAVKQKVRDKLSRKEYSELAGLCREDKRYWNSLRSHLYESDDGLRRAAIEAVARIMKEWWLEGDREKVREYIRGQLWQLNDESGNIGWSAPEVIAEIIVAVPELIEPYGRIMVGSALGSRVLIDSSLWAIGRLGKRISKELCLSRENISAFFSSESARALGLAAWAMGEAGVVQALEPLKTLNGREEPVRIYCDGGFREKPLGEWAKEAIVKLNRSNAAPVDLTSS